MSNQDRDNADGLISLLAGIGVGVLLGGAVALLLAPQSGEQTRTQLRDSVDDTLGRLRESMDDLRVKVEEVAGSARDAVASRVPGAGGGAGDSGAAGGTGALPGDTSLEPDPNAA